MRINPIFVMSKGNNNNLKFKDYGSKLLFYRSK